MSRPALTGPQKAAIAVLSLEEDLAASLIAALPETDLRKLTRAVNELDSVSDDVLVQVIDELDRSLHGGASLAGAGAQAYMRKLANAALGEQRASQLFLPPAERALSAGEVLRTARVDALAELLMEEHPQIASLVLTQMPPRVAARVLAKLPQALAGDLLARLSSIDEIPEHAVTEASETVVRALAQAGGLATSDQRADFDGLAFSAAMVNEMTQEDGDRMLEHVSEQDDTAAKRIREAMFTFEDLLRVDARQMATLLRAVSGDTLTVALQSAGDDLKEHFLGAMSKRAAETVRDDLAAMAPKRVAEVEAAQREIVELASKMAAEGSITLPARGGDE